MGQSAANNSMRTDTDSPALSLRLFGTFSLEVRGEPANRLSRAAQELLTFLALCPNAPVSRERIAESLWPDATRDHGLFYLRRCLTEVRGALGHEQVRLLSPTRTTLQIDLHGAVCDVARFDQLARKEEPACLEEVVSCHVGQLLYGCNAGWIVSERADRLEVYMAAVQALAVAREKEGDFLGAVRLQLRATMADPLSERAARRLMRSLAKQGDFGGVERTFRSLRESLHRELNLEPSSETRALHARLRSLAKVARDAEGEMEAVAPTNRRMPLALTSLVGRAADVREIGAILRSARLVTLVGPGGVGKTRLAIAVADTVGEEHPDGSTFVDLVSSDETTDLPSVVAAALGVETAGRTLGEYLRRKELLLVLDNAEHVLVPCARMATRLIAECPSLRLICTSREPLRVPGERVWQVAPLAVPPPSDTTRYRDADVEDLSSYSGVALLVERAREASPSFELNARNAAAVAQICRRLDGVPLALELVAARFRSLSAEGIAERLEDAFCVLSSGRTAIPRQRSLRSTLEWSYNLLDEAERRVLRRLSVFAGTWTLAAAEAVCSGGNHEDAVLPILMSLVEKSLVVYVAGDDQDRYRLLEMTRQFVSGLTSPEERDAQSERHAVFFLRLVQRLIEEKDESDSDHTSTHYWPDHDNIQAAHRWWQQRDEDAARWLEYFLYASKRRRPEDWQFRVAALNREPLQASSLGLLITYEVGCWALWSGHDARSALLRRADEMAAAIGNPKWRSMTLCMLSVLEDEQGNDAQTLAYVEAALDCAKISANRYTTASLEARAASLQAQLGDYSTARYRLQRQVDIGRRTGEWAILLPSLFRLGEIEFDLGNWTGARACWEERLLLALRFDRFEVPNVWRMLACAAREMGDFDGAWHCLREGLAASRRNRSLDREGWIRWQMAETALRQGNLADAIEHLHRCLRTFQDNDEPRVVAQCLRKAAFMHRVNGSDERASAILGFVMSTVKRQELPLLRGERTKHDALATELRESLGADAWQAAFNRGTALTPSQVETLAFERMDE